MDYNEMKGNLKAIAGSIETTNKRHSPFKGSNFMTPDIVARRQMKNGVWFELSLGTGIGQDHLYGLTFDKTLDANGWNLCCYSLDSVKEVLKEVSELI